jgi:type I restriction enzyme S subunit
MSGHHDAASESSAWVVTTMGALGRLHCGQSPPSAEVNSDGNGTPYVSGPEQWDGNAVHLSKWTTAPGRTAPAGTVFITVKGSGVGTLFPGVAAAIGRDIYAFEPHASVNFRFVYRALQFSINDVIGKARGDIPGLSKDHILQHPIAISGPRTQENVASKIDELFSRIDEGERALERVSVLVERYRQSVLKAAVTGELTRAWREKNKHTLESGEALLARILTARREAWEKAELAKMKAKGITPANDKWKQKYQEPSPPDTTDLPELPDGWSWASVDQVGLVTGGLTKNQKRGEHELRRPFLRVANVYANRLELDDMHEIGVAESELDRVLLKKGDVLVVEGNGSIEQIGRVALWDGSIEGCVHQNHLIKVRCTELLPSWYVLIWCMSPLGRAQIRRVASSTAGLHTLSISKIQALPSLSRPTVSWDASPTVSARWTP